MAGPLSGLGVLVTRPDHQAGSLCQLIESRGGTPIRYPALLIREPRDWASALAVFDGLADYDLAIFTSANAVERALPLIQQRGGLPPALEIAAVGKATARKLAQFGIDRCLQPESFSSEGLLALMRFRNVAGQRIAIVGGENGRALLADALTARGARVDRAEVYRRERPSADSERLLECWARGEIGAVVVTSTEILLNLFDMLSEPGQGYLRDTPLVAISPRTRQTAAEYGCRRLLLSENASDDAIVSTLLDLAANLSSVQFGDAI
ncbi:MAG: uroporphyrinogen-III synthase [Candidatus Competibacteraceae bacterium]|nr:uroporphyrinogen-III synthase [Candidatus Competibacteraceae bacterium]MBK7983058.1 uroporphyrinogen-III synthase [Candidatus Competibacteraceae bacterium]MBK8898389.1 uroporphyrinogen-III synthase [Candidatus Competibacteraceae bacterium]MBK8962199.1 uroporphyrinogen-III synthase [Candidatus Competibacteraceae bacterium]MBK9951415.1 uroporphyrinogen-III synthase [Candidatus Competibacteraceae bacterium]